MSISVVGTTSAVRSGSTVTLSVPTGVQNGDLLIVGMAVNSTLSVDFSVLPSQPPAGRYNIRLYSYDPSNPAPLMWSDGDLTVEVRV